MSTLQSPWSLLQVLSGHVNPERSLVIGNVGPRTYESAAPSTGWILDVDQLS